MYVVYLIKCDNLSYVGMTNDIFKRLRQHNGEISGGAKYTSKKKRWYPVLIIDGFQDILLNYNCIPFSLYKIIHLMNEDVVYKKN